MKRLATLLLTLTLTLTFNPSWGKDKNTSDSKNASVSESYLQKTKAYFEKTGSYSYGSFLKDEKKLKEAAKILKKTFTEEDLDTFITFYNSPVYEKMKSNEYYELSREIEKIAYEDYYKEQNVSTSKKSKKTDSYASTSYDYCESDSNAYAKEIRKAIKRTKRICGISEYPKTLDDAEDGEGDYYENRLFNKILASDSYGSGEGWTKKGNTYTWTCRDNPKKKKVFVYDPSNGTFETK